MPKRSWSRDEIRLDKKAQNRYVWGALSQQTKTIRPRNPANLGELKMAKRKKKAQDKPAAPCVLCGSTDWCNCEWDTLVPTQLVYASTPTQPRRQPESDVAQPPRLSPQSRQT